MSTTLIATSLGCLRHPLQPFSLEMPPLILTPASKAGVSDGRGRFREIYCAVRADHGWQLPEDLPCEEAIVRLDGEPLATGSPVALGRASGRLRVVVVPGIFGECVNNLVSPFADARAHLETHGYRTGMIHVSGTSSTSFNAAQIRDAVIRTHLEPGERLLLVGYSKGVADALDALVSYPEIVPHVAALASVAGVVAGSPLADGFPDALRELLRVLDPPICEPGDGGGVASLRRTVRLRALAQASLPRSISYFSVAGVVDRTQVSRVLRTSWGRLAEVDPRNDGQVVFSDAVIPNGVLLGFVRADHWAIALPFSRSVPVLKIAAVDRNAFPREVLLEAIVRMIEEAIQ